MWNPISFLDGCWRFVMMLLRYSSRLGKALFPCSITNYSDRFSHNTPPVMFSYEPTFNVHQQPWSPYWRDWCLTTAKTFWLATNRGIFKALARRTSGKCSWSFTWNGWILDGAAVRWPHRELLSSTFPMRIFFTVFRNDSVLILLLDGV